MNGILAEPSKYDGNSCGCALGGQRPGQPPAREEDIDLEADQICGKVGKLLVLAVRPTILEGDVPSFDVPALQQTLSQRLDWRDGTRYRAQHPHAVTLPSGLRPGRERRGEEGKTQDDQHDGPWGRHTSAQAKSRSHR